MATTSGGAPKYGGGSDAGAADEGEADYYANAKCLHRIFAGNATASFTRMAVSDDGALIAAACAKSYKNSGEQALCVRAATAGLSVTALLGSLGGEAPAHIDTPDAGVVAATNDEHPASQCRLDTYYQATLCTKSYTIDMSPTDPAVGACVLSQGYTVGMRPFCWYKPGAAELTGQSGAAVAASAEKQSHASSSPTLASLKSSSVFSGL